MNEVIVSCDPRLKTWMNLFSSLHRCLRPFHPIWMEPARVRIAEHRNLDYTEVMSRRNIYRGCYLISIFFYPFIGHFIQQKPFHSLIRRHLIRSVVTGLRYTVYIAWILNMCGCIQSRYLLSANYRGWDAADSKYRV